MLIGPQIDRLWASVKLSQSRQNLLLTTSTQLKDPLIYSSNDIQ